MITWMQRHKKYLIVTIWISTIAFVGAGFVGWGQYSYGDKAGAVAKVGNVEITMGELQKSYSNLYNQYSQIFRGNFDEEKAKSFGLQSQALKHLTQQALIINLAHSYNLEISDEELLSEIKKQKYFFKDGVFDKEIYKQVLSKNNLTVKEFEAGIKKDLLIRKTLELFAVDTNDNESKIIDTAINIADKIDYKLLDGSNINIAVSDEVLKPFWEGRKQNFMNPVSYELKFIKQATLSKEYDEAKLNEYYNENKTHFKGDDDRILAYENAKDMVKKELNEKETKKEALRSYIAFKKGELTEDTKVEDIAISSVNNPFGSEILEKVASLTPASPFLKPVLVNGEYITFKLLKKNSSQTNFYEDAKAELLPQYMDEQKKSKLYELAKNSVSAFKGTTSDFVTAKDFDKLTNMDENKAKEFLNELFGKHEKRGFITLSDGSIVLYNILEQKLLKMANTDANKQMVRLKSAMFDEGLMKNLQNKYKTEIFIQGL